MSRALLFLPFLVFLPLPNSAATAALITTASGTLEARVTARDGTTASDFGFPHRQDGRNFGARLDVSSPGGSLTTELSYAWERGITASHWYNSLVVSPAGERVELLGDILFVTDQPDVWDIEVHHHGAAQVTIDGRQWTFADLGDVPYTEAGYLRESLWLEAGEHRLEFSIGIDNDGTRTVPRVAWRQAVQLRQPIPEPTTRLLILGLVAAAPLFNVARLRR